MLGQIHCTFPMEKPLIAYNNAGFFDPPTHWGRNAGIILEAFIIHIHEHTP